MKRHLIGFAVFSLIAGAGIFANSVFFASENSVSVSTPEIDYSKVTKNSCWKTKRQIVKAEKLISYKMEEVSVANKNVLTAKIRFDWNGGEELPDALSYNVKFFTEAEPLKAVEVASETIQSPFSESNTVTKTFALTVKNKKAINPRENYYAYLDVTSIELEKTDSVRKHGELNRIILGESEMLADAVPVTIVHDK